MQAESWQEGLLAARPEGATPEVVEEPAAGLSLFASPWVVTFHIPR